MPLQTGNGRKHYGELLAKAAELADKGLLRPLVSEQRFSTREIETAYALVEESRTGKAVIEMQ